MGMLGCPKYVFVCPILGHSRNGYARLSQICECLDLIWGILGMGMLGCPKYVMFVVLFWDILGMGMLGCPKYANCWSYCEVF